MNNLENKEILPEDILKVIDLIIEKCPYVVFGGSIALNAVGLLNRKILDIDLFLLDTQSLTRTGLFTIESLHDCFSDTVTNTNGKEIQRTGTKINGVKICIFNVDKEELQCSKFNFLGRTIYIQNVNYAIQAKIAYSDRNPKHKKDLENINKTLDDLSF